MNRITDLELIVLVIALHHFYYVVNNGLIES